MVTSSASRLVDAKECAQILGVTVGTLAVWRCTRRYALPWIRCGRSIRYRLDHIDAFLASRTNPGTSLQGCGEVIGNA